LLLGICTRFSIHRSKAQIDRSSLLSIRVNPKDFSYKQVELHFHFNLNLL
jgi:hypothetical protein